MLFDWQAIILTLKLASITTIVLLILGTPLAWWLAKSKNNLKEVIGSLVALPLVLPPTVIGFYLLLLLSPQSFVGQMMKSMGWGTLPFTFTGLVIGSVIYSLPFVVQPIRNSFELVGNRPMEVAATLRVSPLKSFFQIAIPLARPGFITGSVLGFAHTVGEFGVILMIGGNIPGETRVISVAIYDHVESLEWDKAHSLSALMVIFAFVVIYSMYLIEKRLGSRRQ